MPEVFDHALLWLRSYLAHLAYLARRTWRWATLLELLALLTAFFTWLASLLGAIVSDGSWWDVLAWSIWLAVAVDIIVGHGRERRSYAELLDMKPTGAPRMAQVRCRDGHHHKFMYGPEGWAEIN
jgi:hypothetical protein